MTATMISPKWLNAHLKDLELLELAFQNTRPLSLPKDCYENFLDHIPCEVLLNYDQDDLAVSLIKMLFPLEQFDNLIRKLTELYDLPESMEYHGTSGVLNNFNELVPNEQLLWQWRNNGTSFNLKPFKDYIVIEIFNT